MLCTASIEEDYNETSVFFFFAECYSSSLNGKTNKVDDECRCRFVVRRIKKEGLMVMNSFGLVS